MYGHQWASYQIPIIAGCACPRMSGTFSPPLRVSDPPLLVSDPGMHHGTCITHVPWCMSGSLTSSFVWRRLRGKRSRYSLHMRNPPFYVSGKRPIICYNAHCHDIWDIWKHKQHHYRLHIFPQRKKWEIRAKLSGVKQQLFSGNCRGKGRRYIRQPGIFMVWCKTVVKNQLLTQWRCCELAQSHQYM